MHIAKVKVLTSILLLILLLCSDSLSRLTFGQQPTGAQDPAYRSGRRSLCQNTQPPGKPLPAHRSDSGIQSSGYRAERVITYIADAGSLKGGDIALCSEYGRIDIMDSDDGQVRLQVRCEALGEGAAKAIEDTDIRAHFTSDQGKLKVAVWHATQGFTPTSQPCWVSIRLQVPLSRPYQIDAMANHGRVGVHRLTLAACKLRGLVGLKVKGVKGYQGGHDLDNVILVGDIDISTEGPSDFGDAWIHGTLRAISSCKVQARTNGGSVQLYFTPDPRVGLDVIGRSDAGTVLMGINDGTTVRAAPESRTDKHVRTREYENRPIKITVTATSSKGNVTVASAM